MKGYNDPTFIPHGTQVSRGTDRSSVFRRTQTTKGTGLKIHYFRSTTMNTLNLIRKQIEKQSALHDAQISHTAYRGIVTKKFAAPAQEVHGKFTYRGHTYTK